jgi:hypothetical protein
VERTLTAVFDGSVFRPDMRLDLKPNTCYVVVVQELPAAVEGDAWKVLESLTGTVEAPQDWSIEHDHYMLLHT